VAVLGQRSTVQANDRSTLLGPQPETYIRSWYRQPSFRDLT
jgi:hypothetical protein